jgi:phage baseplate assembly protein W
MALTFISFKNVGIKQFDAIQLVSVVSQSVVSYGIKTPVSLGANAEGLFSMNNTLGDQIRDNLHNLILTNHGERFGLYDYGANLLPLVTEFTSIDAFSEEAMLRINTAVSKYMSFVQLEGFAVEPAYEENRYTGIIEIYVKFSVPAANITAQTLNVTLRVIG